MTTTLFSLPAGQQVVVLSNRVTLHGRNRSMTLEREETVKLTLTDEFCDVGGVRHRKGIDVDPPAPGNHIWFSDAPCERGVRG